LRGVKLDGACLAGIDWTRAQVDSADWVARLSDLSPAPRGRDAVAAGWAVVARPAENGAVAGFVLMRRHPEGNAAAESRTTASS
jgi:hypothetical protein